MKPKLSLDGTSLRLEDLLAVAFRHCKVVLSPDAKRKMRRSRAWVEQALLRRDVVYGVSTGFGAFQNVPIAPDKLRELQRNLILSHCAGVGEPFPDEVVRIIMLLRANALAKGFSGIRVSTVEFLLRLLEKDILPVIPSKGSVGASGDLAPLAHMAAAMIGEGSVRVRGRLKRASSALRAAGMKPIILDAKEGLALTNGTQAMTAVGALSLYYAGLLADVADAAAAMTLEAVKGKRAPFAPEVHRVRKHPGQAVSARNILSMIQGSRLVDRNDEDTRNHVQDSYSIRCAPQVHGASRDAMEYVRNVLSVEMNSATDNPLIFARENVARSAGNFHGQPVALAMDFLSLATAELGSISERRIAKLMDKHQNSGLPAFLAHNGGVQSGLMIAQYTAAALASENKVLMHPASGDSIPTSANQEDHVSMGTISAGHANRIVQNVLTILSIELLCAAQALEFRSERVGKGTAELLKAIRKRVPPLRRDRELSGDIESIASMIREGVTIIPWRRKSRR